MRRPVRRLFRSISIGALGATLIAFAGGAPGRLNLGNWAAVVGGGLAVGFVALVARWMDDLAMTRAVRSKTPEAALRFLDSHPNERLMPAGARALTAHDAAVVNALFGRFDEARAALAAIDWSSRPPLARTAGLRAEALLDLLESGDPARARNVLKRAERAASESSSPMSEADRSELYALVVASELLLGEMLPITVQQSELAARSEHELPKLISNWALGVHWWREEERDRAKAHFEICRKLAPHCELLHRAPPISPRRGLAR